MNSIDRINMVLEYIEQKLCEEQDETHIAKIAACSFAQFQRIFSYLSGMPLHEYIRKRKLTVAAIDLKRGQENITDIAFRYGYDTPSGFTRAFKAYHHATPTEVINGEKEPVLFDHLFFLNPLNSRNQTYRVEKGRVKMAKLSQIDFKKFGPYKVIGRAFDTTQLSNDIPMQWGKFFADGSLDILMKLCQEQKHLTDLPDAYAGAMFNFKENGEFTYLIGIVFSMETIVPEGFVYFELPEGMIAEARISGEEYEIYAQGHEIIISAVEGAGYSIDWENFYKCEVYTDIRFSQPKQIGEKILTLDYYIPITA